MPNEADRPGLDVVIVTYGRSDLVRSCLTSIEAWPAETGTCVTVVDNNSPDDTPEVVAREFPGVRLLRRHDNPGFAVANNVALRQVTARWILVLNPDTAVPWETVEHLLQVMDGDPTIGVTGCRLELTDGSLDHAAKRFIPSPGAALTYFLGRLLRVRVGAYVAPKLGPYEAGPVDAVNGAFMLIRREAMEQVGLLDERYWMYAEDLDWCVRFKEAGWQVVYDGTVRALHIKGASATKRRPTKLNYHFHRSMWLFYRSRLAPQSNPIMTGLVFLGIWTRFALLEISHSVRGRSGRGEATSPPTG